MRIAVRCAGLMIALALLTASALAQQQAPERKPVPTFTDEDAPAGSACIRRVPIRGAGQTRRGPSLSRSAHE